MSASQATCDASVWRHLAAVKTLASIHKLLTSPPSPIEIATKLDRVSWPSHRARDGVAGTVGVHN